MRKSKINKKQIDIKNHMCYNYGDVVKDRDIYSVDSLLDEKS